MSQGTAAARVTARPAIAPPGPARHVPALRVVAPLPRRGVGALVVTCVVALVGGLLALLLLNIGIGEGAYTLTELQREQRSLAQERQALAEQVEAAGAPHRLAEQARRLGMVPAPSSAFVRLPDGRIEGHPETAKAPPRPKPEVTRSATAQQPLTKKPAATKPGATKSRTKPGATKPGTKKPAATKPGTTKPGTTEPRVTKPAARTRPEATRPAARTPAP